MTKRMNNFLFTQDPLLYQSYQPSQMTGRANNPDMAMRQQLDSAVAQYQAMQQQMASNQRQMEEKMPKDFLGELDKMLQGLDKDVAERLGGDEEYQRLNAQVQQTIQDEIMRSVKWKVNSNPDAVAKIESMIAMVQAAKKEREAADKRNIAEINDYLKNYSSMSFDEYKRIKNEKTSANEN